MVLALAVVAGMTLLHLASGGFSSLPKVGSEPRAFELSLLDGDKLSLDSLRGKVVLLDFWATWCPPCVASMPVVHRVARDLEASGVVTVAINRDDVAPEKREALIRRFVETHGLDGLQVALDDGEAAGVFRVRALPTLVVLGPDGKVAASHLGGIDEATLRRLLAPIVQAGGGA